MVGKKLRLTRDITSPGPRWADATPYGKKGDVVTVVKLYFKPEAYGVLVENEQALRYRVFASEYTLLD